MSNDHEIDRMMGEGFMAHPDAGEGMDQASEIQRLKDKLDDPRGGVPLPGHEERSVHVILATATVLRGGLDHLMHGSECTPILDRLLGRFENILGTIRGTVCAPVEENVVLLMIDCEDVLLEMQRARGADTGMKDKLRTWLKVQRLKKMAAGMGDKPGAASAN